MDASRANSFRSCRSDARDGIRDATGGRRKSSEARRKSSRRSKSRSKARRSVRRDDGPASARSAESSRAVGQRARWRLTLFACFPSAVRTRFGSFAIVRLRRATAAAFLTFRRAADRCLELVIVSSSATIRKHRSCRRCNDIPAPVTAGPDARNDNTSATSSGLSRQPSVAASAHRISVAKSISDARGVEALTTVRKCASAASASAPLLATTASVGMMIS